MNIAELIYPLRSGRGGTKINLFFQSWGNNPFDRIAVVVRDIFSYNEKPAFAKASADAVEPSRIKSNSFLKGINQIERFISIVK
jgi:hypothetical protein